MKENYYIFEGKDIFPTCGYERKRGLITPTDEYVCIAFIFMYRRSIFYYIYSVVCWQLSLIETEPNMLGNSKNTIDNFLCVIGRPTKKIVYI